jgi:hypothetical protein
MQFEKISLQAYSGYKVNERPESFIFRGKQYQIIEIIDRWYEGSGGPAQLDYFKVITDDQQQYILRYNSLFDVWSILLAHTNPKD